MIDLYNDLNHVFNILFYISTHNNFKKYNKNIKITLYLLIIQSGVFTANFTGHSGEYVKLEPNISVYNNGFESWNVRGLGNGTGCDCSE